MSTIERNVHTFFHSHVSSTRVVSYSYENLPVCRTWLHCFHLVSCHHLAEIFDIANSLHSQAHASLCVYHFKQPCVYLYV